MLRRLLLASAAISAAGLAQPAVADGYGVPPPVAFVEGFRWTGCYGGLHAGGAWGDWNLTDPVQLVQDQISGTPVTTGVTEASQVNERAASPFSHAEPSLPLCEAAARAAAHWART